MRILCIQTGVVRGRRQERGLGRYLWSPWLTSTLPVNAFVVEHPEGILVFDTGQTARATRSGYFPRWHPFFRLSRFELSDDDELVPKLQARGIEPADVRWVALSHLHTDHVGGLEAFAGREVLVSRGEWERARGLRGRVRGYLPQHWPHAIEPKLVDLDRGGFGPFPGAYDVAGDGTILLAAIPGHTPGHAGLLVRRPEGAVLLSGDLGHAPPGQEGDSADVAGYCAEHEIAIVGSHDVCAAVIAGREGQAV